jgi:hypothetical protein
VYKELVEFGQNNFKQNPLVLLHFAYQCFKINGIVLDKPALCEVEGKTFAQFFLFVENKLCKKFVTNQFGKE